MPADSMCVATDRIQSPTDTVHLEGDLTKSLAHHTLISADGIYPSADSLHASCDTIYLIAIAAIPPAYNIYAACRCYLLGSPVPSIASPVFYLRRGVAAIAVPLPFTQHALLTSPA
jgi:hypothetical protein